VHEKEIPPIGHKNIIILDYADGCTLHMRVTLFTFKAIYVRNVQNICVLFELKKTIIIRLKAFQKILWETKQIGELRNEKTLFSFFELNSVPGYLGYFKRSISRKNKGQYQYPCVRGKMERYYPNAYSAASGQIEINYSKNEKQLDIITTLRSGGRTNVKRVMNYFFFAVQSYSWIIQQTPPRTDVLSKILKPWRQSFGRGVFNIFPRNGDFFLFSKFVFI
jgi:hypothetical protein